MTGLPHYQPDIVERLRLHFGRTGIIKSATFDLVHEAADHIDRLTERCEVYKGQVQAGSIEIAALKSRVEDLTKALESIAGWRNVNISGEYEHGLRDIIRSVVDCAVAGLEASSMSLERSGGAT